METSLSKYASIHITFPSSNYPELPYPPNLATCFLNLSFSSCLLTGSTYVITLDEPYESDRSLTFSIDNIINPSATTDPFIIQTYYDS